MQDPTSIRRTSAVLLAFLRLSTQARIFEAPLKLSEALSLVDGWLEQLCAVIVHPTDRHSALLRELLGTLGTILSSAHRRSGIPKARRAPPSGAGAAR